MILGKYSLNKLPQKEKSALSKKLENDEWASGYKIGEQMTNFIRHYLETKGSDIRIKNLNMNNPV